MSHVLGCFIGAVLGMLPIALLLTRRVTKLEERTNTLEYKVRFCMRQEDR